MGNSAGLKKITKILIANRGEIAVRIINTAREMGIKTVAVFSEIDRRAKHVLMSNEAICIGENQPQASYLNVEKIIDAAKKTGSDAIHPGYGFLSENPLLSKRCNDEGIIFIGPPPDVISALGDKVESRILMSRASIPIIPGTLEKSTDVEFLIKRIHEIGFPVMLKASGGGGGKAMKIIKSSDDLREKVESSLRESKSAFSDSSLYIEKYIEDPRHIEFQILRDKFGNTIHLCERECSIQRRHQKIIEETPSTALTPELREKMGEAAKNVAEIANYINAGTVEFLVDKNKIFYFLEVNTRIQVEHPVTEMVLGIDIVREQIRIAEGHELALKQENIKPHGHSIECRIYAEDPENNFMPSPGKITLLKEPKSPFVRVDSGVIQGSEVPIYYDPIISKLIVWAERREIAIDKMVAALNDYVIFGIKTSIPFLKDTLKNQDFINGQLSTNFINEKMAGWRETESEVIHGLISAAIINCEKNIHSQKMAECKTTKTPWHTVGNWRLFHR